MHKQDWHNVIAGVYSTRAADTTTLATNLPSDKWLQGCSSTWALSFGFLVMVPNFAGIKTHKTHKVKLLINNVSVCTLTPRSLPAFCRLQYERAWYLFLMSEIRIRRKGLTVCGHIGSQHGKQRDGTRLLTTCIKPATHGDCHIHTKCWVSVCKTLLLF